MIKKLVPGWLKSKVYRAVVAQVKENNKAISQSIPRTNIPSQSIKNTKLLSNRVELLRLLPKHGVVAELGVDQGGFSELILKLCEPQKLHLVDLWDSERYNQNKRKHVEDKFKTEIGSGRVKINLGFSTEVVARFENSYFDWVYIDTDHSYKTTIKELEILRPKIKPGGIIAGHDFIIGNWDGIVRYGVIEAVYEFCSKYNWEILYLTMEIDNHPSFAIREIFQ
ncbi:class I SAM-dependent methyltransferase [Rufibacter hautae]|uniref:Class I SAM-dependent methyltransferase n=1 Tax=Rufibacter hautae TaxID=2595005 RepID=A0A5B6TPX2_9BACT|nr:class I SAM-dependent methyltransferase [Rufibacter hautae]KAA3438473.1 class I SAM-dependent methyltransferase [Rufibacter hautae]